MDSVQEIIEQQDRYIKRSVHDLEAQSSSILHKVSVALLALLGAKLLTRQGKIVLNAANLKLIEDLPAIFNQYLTEFGFDDELTKFVRDLDAQPVFFEHLLAAQGVQDPPVFTPAEREYVDAKKEIAAALLLEEAARAGQRIKLLALTSFGEQTVPDLGATVLDTLNHLPGRLAPFADTQAMSFYRSVADLGYDVLARRSPGHVQHFAYVGPGAGDPVIRKFCKRLMLQAAAGKTWTKEEIDMMDNGQLPNVFVTCGGHDCRHQWLLSLGRNTP